MSEPIEVVGPALTDAESVAKAIALVIAEKMIRDDGGFNSTDKGELAHQTAENMWPALLEEAKAAMRACGIA